MISVAIKQSKNVARAKARVFWLLMLYYEGSRLNGSGCPFGIETQEETTLTRLHFESKWLWLPVRD